MKRRNPIYLDDSLLTSPDDIEQGLWECYECGAVNHEYDAECQFCEPECSTARED